MCRGLAMLMAASRCSRAPKAGVDEITVAGKAGNLLHSAEEIDINECLIAGEEILTAANTPQVVGKKTHTHTSGCTHREEAQLIFCTHVGVLYAQTHR